MAPRMKEKARKAANKAIGSGSIAKKRGKVDQKERQQKLLKKLEKRAKDAENDKTKDIGRRMAMDLGDIITDIRQRDQEQLERNKGKEKKLRARQQISAAAVEEAAANLERFKEDPWAALAQ
ncbi:hypothetical protein J8273_7038 [Carpediemonas membranifera]|uniref:Uncharacterized protein n=1 Tax=Carpediemonas membranifera TaxID=201153 RepID=A0A8J6ARY5_9EUKA|nr:hypothetical protein J8273_7038 [Carpediemonas membranifera]|eukprot:KAG9390785.1 hypothetical protein J8273_7038 [Carpediemonas membranifera]